MRDGVFRGALSVKDKIRQQQGPDVAEHVRSFLESQQCPVMSCSHQINVDEVLAI